MILLFNFIKGVIMQTEQINLRLSKEWIQRLKQIARQEAIEQDKDINYLTLIKTAIKEKYNLEE